MSKRVLVYAEWLCDTAAGAARACSELLDDGIALSHGRADNEQGEGFHMESKNATLTCTKKRDGWHIRFECSASCADFPKGYWLSPTYLDGADEAHIFGARVITRRN